MHFPARDNANDSDRPQSNAAQPVTAERYSVPMLRELTARDMDEQRRLVRASLLASAT